MIRAVIFDCFGVLTTDQWREFIASIPEDQRQSARDINRSYDAGFIDEPEYLKQIYDLTDRKPNLVTLNNGGPVTKNIDLLKYIKTLRANYKIGLISNIANNWIRESFLSLAEQKLFDAMIMSFEVRAIKPDPKIYKLTAEKLAVASEECIFIDDVEMFCKGAQEVGMQAIVYQNFEQMKAELEKLLAKG